MMLHRNIASTLTHPIMTVMDDLFAAGEDSMRLSTAQERIACLSGKWDAQKAFSRAHIAELKSNSAKMEHENQALKAKMGQIAHENEELAAWFRESILPA
jgi:cysteinyl-tRNA synthetase